MLSRLVMVVVVAALGVTVPSGPEFRRVFGAIQHWAATRLAMFDTWTPGRDGRVVLAGNRPPRPRLMVVPGLAKAVASGAEFVGPRVTTVLRARRASREIPVMGMGPVILPRMLVTRGLMERLAPATVAKVERPAPPPSATPARPRSSATEPFEGPILASEGVALALAWDLERRLETVTVERPEPLEVKSPADVASTAAPDLEESVGEDAWESFEIPAPLVVQEAPRPEVDFEPLELCGEVAWEPAYDATDADHPATVRNAEKSWEPMEWPKDLDQGVAYELNRASDGLSRAGAPVVAPVAASAPRSPQRVEAPGSATVIQAVRLTREALGAWLGVIRATEMRVVTIR